MGPAVIGLGGGEGGTWRASIATSPPSARSSAPRFFTRGRSYRLKGAVSAPVLARAAIDPPLSRWIEAELATKKGLGRDRFDASRVAMAARAAPSGRYERRDKWDGYQARGHVSQLQALVAKAVPLMETEEGRNALAVLEAIADVFIDDWIAWASGSDERGANRDPRRAECPPEARIFVWTMLPCVAHSPKIEKARPWKAALSSHPGPRCVSTDSVKTQNAID